MEEELSFADANMIFLHSTLMYKGTPCYFAGLSADMVALIRELDTNKLRRVKFKFSDYGNVDARLGYVNYGPIAVYLFRRAARVYKIGLTTDNVRPMYGEFRYDEAETGSFERDFYALQSENISQTLQGNYPSFSEAYDMVKSKEHRLVAFDRQFALSYKGGVYYKSNLIGTLNLEKHKDISDIQMKAGYESLFSVMSNTFRIGAQE